MQEDYIFFRLHMLIEFLDQVKQHREKLLEELINKATDPVIRMRRFRMLSQLSQYESQIINKISQLETNNKLDFLRPTLTKELNTVVDRNA